MSSQAFIHSYNDTALKPSDQESPLKFQDKHINEYYKSLQCCLQKNHFPETIDRTQSPKNHDDGIAVVFLAPPLKCLSTVLEGSKYSPGSFLIVLSTSWLSKKQSTYESGLYSLFVKKAIVFNRNGESFLDIFHPPTMTTYLVNFYKRACSEGQRCDGEDIEVGIDCPTSDSTTLTQRLDDKILSRILMAEFGLLYPATFAITNGHSNQYFVPNNANITLVSVGNKMGCETKIRNALRTFLKKMTMESTKKVIIKLTGGIWHGSRYMTCHDVINLDDIVAEVLNVLSVIEVDNVIIIEPMTHTAFNNIPALAENTIVVRSHVCRGPEDTAVTSLVECGIGSKVGSDMTHIPFEQAMAMLNVDPLSLSRIKNEIVTGSEKLANRIFEYETFLSTETRGERSAQTDYMGIDSVLTDVNGKLEPFFLEIKSHSHTMNNQFQNNALKDQAEAVIPFVETMIRRSRAFLMSSKNAVDDNQRNSW